MVAIWIEILTRSPCERGKSTAATPTETHLRETAHVGAQGDGASVHQVRHQPKQRQRPSAQKPGLPARPSSGEKPHHGFVEPLALEDARDADRLAKRGNLAAFVVGGAIDDHDAGLACSGCRITWRRVGGRGLG